MNTFYVIEKGSLYLGISCGQFRYYNLDEAIKFHDVVSAKEVSNILGQMFGSISDEFRNVKITEHITEFDADDHTLEEISPFIKRVYFDKDENDFRIANRPNKKTANAEKAVII
jgi:hypothetical protein